MKTTNYLMVLSILCSWLGSTTNLKAIFVPANPQDYESFQSLSEEEQLARFANYYKRFENLNIREQAEHLFGLSDLVRLNQTHTPMFAYALVVATIAEDRGSDTSLRSAVIQLLIELVRAGYEPSFSFSLFTALRGTPSCHGLEPRPSWLKKVLYLELLKTGYKPAVESSDRVISNLLNIKDPNYKNC